eukprot:144573_1
MTTLQRIDELIEQFTCNDIKSQLITPDYISQLNALQRLQKYITKDVIEKEIINSMSETYKLIKFNPLPEEDTGLINLIYCLMVQDSNNKTYEWILRICNPHKHFMIKTKWEVIVMNIVSKHCPNIKLPKIINYSDNIHNKPLIGYQYILMEKLEGIILDNIEENLSQQRKNYLYIKWCNMINELRSIRIPLSTQQIGIWTDETMKKYTCRGVKLKPTNNLIQYHKMYFFDYIIEHLKYSYYNKDYMPSFGNLFTLNTINHLNKSFEKVIDKLITPMQYIIDNNNTYNDDEKQQQWFYLNHNDFHYQNIMVTDNNNQCEIVGLLDWESANISFFPMDIFYISDLDEEWNIPSDIIEKYKPKLDHILYKNLVFDIEDLRNIHRYAKEMIFYTVTLFMEDSPDMNILYQRIKQYKLEAFNDLKQTLINLNCW